MNKKELLKELAEFSDCNSVGSVMILEAILNDFFSQNVVIPKSDIEHLEWIYHRMVDVYDCNKNLDYMIKFASIIGIKPQDQVYEWQYATHKNNNDWLITGYLTDEEVEKVKSEISSKYLCEYVKLDFTKRERK